jgi:ribonucleoside-diphosphate reductase alpha chain
MYKSAWRSGLKTTDYLRTLQASNIEKATVEIVKEMRGSAAVPASAVLPIEGEKVCSLEARMRGEECEACQ